MAVGSQAVGLLGAEMSAAKWWADDPYWVDALKDIQEAAEDGGRLVVIDMSEIADEISRPPGISRRLLDAMSSVREHEEYDGVVGVESIIKALLWRLQEISQP